eukprot:CAMPEP_0201478958 /NCGR_PEP_ID=MMETSP0151_2-20130828/3708_1 /ASSEMBLY_ACC=CAM_ASM_000257 /TAXON_ID=200890 /ORGANISM="Paramoeba atlantica, Strain 621/1 / CCAP 1560/9" /LENGTH=326 /DNA_ID=CAMNT_0047860235 /DNA_START=27 /DNA_END=1004 /DNA_ORIENTATION=-
MALEEKGIRFQVASDLHVEFPDVLSSNLFPPIGEEPLPPYLALVGDIGNPTKPTYAKLISEVAKRYKKVFLVTGNHEYFHGTRKTIHRMIEEIVSEFENVYWLENRSITVDGVRIAGCCLWTSIPPKHASFVEERMNEYSMVKVEEEEEGEGEGGLPPKTRPLKASDTDSWHKESVSFIEKEIKQCKKSKTPLVVLTHHAPSSKVEGGCPGYSSPLDHLFGWPLVCWLYGHTHSSQRFHSRGTLIGTNPLGYLNLEPRNVERFFPSFIVETATSKDGFGKNEKDDSGNRKLARVTVTKSLGFRKKEKEKREIEELMKKNGPPKPAP